MGLQLSGSVQLEGNLLVTGSANSVFENISVTNRITANEINVQFVSSSIIYSSGSNKFGDESGDKHQFTGSLVVSGTLAMGTDNTGYGRISFNESSNTLRIQSSKNGTDCTPIEFWSQKDGGGFAQSMIISGSNTGLGGHIPNASYGPLQIKSPASSYTLDLVGRTAGLNGESQISFWNATQSTVLASVGNIGGKLLIDADSIGIGGTPANGKLEIQTSTSASAALWVQTGGTTSAFVIADFRTGTNSPAFRVLGNGNSLFEGNVSVGVTPSAWASPASPALQIKRASLFSYNSGTTDLGYNIYFNGADYIYIANDEATLFRQQNGGYEWYTAPSGTADGIVNFTSSMSLTAAGNLGINSPTTNNEKLVVRQTIDNTSSVGFFTTASLGTSYGPIILAGSNASDASLRVFDQSGTSNYFYVRGDGNTGVGTDSPNIYNISNGAHLTLSTSTANYAVITAAGSAGNGGEIDFGNQTIRHAAIASLDGSNLGFYTNGTNSGTGVTERMRITSGGYLKASNNGVYNNATGTFHEFSQNLNGASSAILAHGGSSDPYGLEVNFTGTDPNNDSNYMFGAYKTSGGFVWIYRIFSNGTVSGRSDARWKKNIETTRNGYIEDLCKLRVVKYNWYNHEDDAPKELGLIAQEVEEVFPNLIQIDPVIAKREVEQEDGTIIEEEFEDGVSRSIKTSVLPFMLLKAIQEQQEQIEELKSRIEQLENN
jgi:hypothetical protein